VNEFFCKYADVSLHGTPAELAALYGSGFVVAGPKGAYGGLNDAAFLGWLEQVQQGNQATGLGALRPAKVGEPVAVGPHHCLVEVEWAATFGEKEVTFSISYLLETEGPRIIGYVSHEDEQDRRREEGLELDLENG
jgi:hypothetical protein